MSEGCGWPPLLLIPPMSLLVCQMRYQRNILDRLHVIEMNLLILISFDL